MGYLRTIFLNNGNFEFITGDNKIQELNPNKYNRAMKGVFTYYDTDAVLYYIFSGGMHRGYNFRVNSKEDTADLWWFKYFNDKRVATTTIHKFMSYY